MDEPQNGIPQLSSWRDRRAVRDVVMWRCDDACDPDGDLLDIEVRDYLTGRDGTIRVTIPELHDAIGECFAEELLSVPAHRIAWRLRS